MSLLPQLDVVVLGDLRALPSRPFVVWCVEVDEKTPLVTAWKRVATTGCSLRSSSTGLPVLQIICHGSPKGLQLCAEGLDLSNVKSASILHNTFRRIELIACSAAGVESGKKGMIGDGEMLCGQLAKVANTFVIASKYRQIATYMEYTNGAKSPLDPGQWEGGFSVFAPTGARALELPF